MVEQHEELVQRYDSDIEPHRKACDIMWKFFDGRERALKRNYLTGLKNVLVQEYGEPTSEHRFPDACFALIDAIIQEDESNMQDLLWFFGLYLCPSMCHWLMQGDPARDVAAPPLASREWTEYFIRNVLAPHCDQLLSAMNMEDNQGNSLDVMTEVSFVRLMRAEYIATVGFAVRDPPANTR